jgi:hypothetical protein
MQQSLMFVNAALTDCEDGCEDGEVMQRAGGRSG